MGGRKILWSTLKLALSSTLMGVIIYTCNFAWFDPLDSLGVRVMVLTGCIFAGVISFITISYLLKNEELNFFLDFIRRRLRKS